VAGAPPRRPVAGSGRAAPASQYADRAGHQPEPEPVLGDKLSQI